jgi:hypothetical protein
LRTIAGAADPDAMRVEALLAVRRVHAGESILAFSEWRSTVHAYWLALRREAGVGMLCAAEARIASGPLPRDELLARFAPRAQRVRAPASHERVTLLVATDLLSEGVNLQDASVVVHLDLPWNPARLAQRLGRVRRPGGADDVASYLMSPPARAALLLQVEARLRAKLARAERTIGRSIGVLPALGPTSFAHDDRDEAQHVTAPVSCSAAETRSEIVHRLTRWRSATARACAPSEDATGTVAAARADSGGWIALLDDGRLVAAHADGEPSHSPSESPEAILCALALADGAARRPGDAERGAALRVLEAWIARDWARRSSGLDVVDTPTGRRVRRALDEAVRIAPRHRRAMIIQCVAIVRDALARPLPIGVERALIALVDAGPRSSCRVNAASRGSSDWLGSAATVVARAPVGSRAPSERGPPGWRVLILLGREADE